MPTPRRSETPHVTPATPEVKAPGSEHATIPITAVLGGAPSPDAPIASGVGGATTGLWSTVEPAPRWPSGQIFRDRLADGSTGPEMIVLPPGEFSMGTDPTDPDHYEDELPRHPVHFAKPIALSRFELTFAEYDQFTAATGRAEVNDRGWARGLRPAINISWEDAQAYVEWLSAQTGERYRLPSEAEWEYSACSAGASVYPWGSEIGRNRANCAGCGSRFDGERTAPVGSFAPNAFGLFDMAGNVYEWTADCDHVNYEGAPDDGSAWTGPECSRHILRGGSWFNSPRNLRCAYRGRNSRVVELGNAGFRVARDLD